MRESTDIENLSSIQTSQQRFAEKAQSQTLEEVEVEAGQDSQSNIQIQEYHDVQIFATSD